MKKTKTNANVVGADFISAKKGITLIALIITIIVMLILVGVTVNVAINGGLFNTAKSAVSGMSKEQTREKAEVVKATLVAEIESGNTIMSVKTEYKDRLKTEFGVTDNEVKTNKVIVEDGKYDIVIKNQDLDIEVVEHSEYIDTSSILSLTCYASNTEVDGKIASTTLNFTLGENLTQEEYVDLRKKEIEEKLASYTIDEKREELLNYLSSEEGTEIDSIDDYLLLILEENGFGPYNTLDECLSDETLKTQLGLTETENLTKGQLYNGLLYDNISQELTEEEVIEELFSELNNANENSLNYEYLFATESLTVNFIKNGSTVKSISSNSPGTFQFSILENGIYEISITDSSSEKNEILREKIVINNIESNLLIVSQGEEWSVISGCIGRYLGNDSEVLVPLQIGDIKSDQMYDTFEKTSKYNYDFLEKVIVPEGMRILNINAFTGCTNLKSISLPSSLTSVGSRAFVNCASLESISLPDNVKSLESSFKRMYKFKRSKIT